MDGLEKANSAADCLENQFSPHDLCDENRERRVEAGVESPLEAVDNNPLKESTQVIYRNQSISWNWKRPVELMVFQMNASGTFQEEDW
jgi:hypothetical protein